MAGIFAKKVGMTQIFDEAGALVPVTILECAEGQVIQRKTTEKDTYDAIVVALPKKRPTKGKKYARATEFRVEADASYAVGDVLGLDTLTDGEKVTVIGTSKGKGFQGVIKRHNFASGPSSHGSKHHRQPGSIGNRKPNRTHKGKKLAGHMGDERVTLHNRTVVALDKQTNCVAIRGAVPGAINSLLIIKK